MDSDCIHHLFEHQAIEHPNQIAIVTHTQTYTYAELNQFANQIAHTIEAHCSTPPSRIALLFDQNASAIAALFGVLKSGNTYIPIDPTFPLERTTAIIDDAQIQLLLTTSEHLNVAKQLANERFPVIDVTEIDSATSGENLARSTSPDTLALILYTSGSTGTPKGVMHSHRTIVHNFWRQWEICRFHTGDRMALLYSPSVMGAVRCIFNGLLAGATLYPYSIKTSGLLRFVELIEQQQLTVIHCVASLFRNITSVLTGSENLAAMRLVMMGGEATTQQDFEEFKRCFPATCQFYVGMGSTEGGSLCAQRLTHSSVVTTALISPGYPCRDITIKLLDEAGGEVPMGESGEITIESPYLALGYWNRPDLNSTVFESIGAIRRFKTGDLGQFLPDGKLVHQGRKDFQVKIRGFRVEVSEIERVLLTTGLQAAIVVSPKSSTDEAYLVAFVVPPSGGSVQIDRLRDRIRQSLPDYMMPKHFCVLEHLPRTPNGKIDRRALLALDVQCDRDNLVLPTTELEQQLAQIWCEVLNCTNIGIHDRFFDLGGHSLAMARIVAQIERILSVPLPASVLFEASTIAQLAKLIDEQQAILNSPVIQFQSHPQPQGAPLFCLPGAGGHFRFCQGLDQFLQDAYPIYGLREQPPDQYDSIGQLAAVYVNTIQQVQPQGEYRIAGYSFGALVALEVAQQLHAQGKTVATLMLLDPSHPPIRFKSIRHGLKPVPERLRNPLYRLLYRFEVHSLRLFALQKSSKLSYLKEKSQLLLRLLFSKPTLAASLEQPSGEWEEYKLYLQLRDRYLPRSYNQPSWLILSEQRSSDPGAWANWRFLLGSSRMIAVCSTNHHSLCQEPAIREVVRLLEPDLKPCPIAIQTP